MTMILTLAAASLAGCSGGSFGTKSSRQTTTAAATTAQATTTAATAQPTTEQAMTAQPTTAEPTTVQPTTVEPITEEPTTSDVQTNENENYSTEEFKSYLTDGKWNCLYLTDLDGNSESIITHHGNFILQTGAYIKFENGGTFNCCMGNDGASGTYTVSGTTVTYKIDTLYTGQGSESISKTYQASFSDVYSKSDKKTYEAISLSFQDGYIHYFAHQ